MSSNRTIIISTLKLIVQALLAYALLLIPYSLVNDAKAASCITTIVTNHLGCTNTSGANCSSPTMKQVTSAVFTPTSTPSSCALVGLTGSEYQALLASDNTLQSNITTVQNNLNTTNSNLVTVTNTVNTHTSSINTLNTSINTLNSNQSVLQTAITAADTKAQNALDTANTALNATPALNPNNIFNITPADAQTLQYAILGLFAIAFVGRMYRRSVSIADSPE